MTESMITLDVWAIAQAMSGTAEYGFRISGTGPADAGQVANLETRDSQQGALHLRHLVETPVTRSLRQVGIDLGLMVADSLDQGAGELRHFGISARLGDMILKRSFRIAAVGLQLEQ